MYPWSRAQSNPQTCQLCKNKAFLQLWLRGIPPGWLWDEGGVHRIRNICRTCFGHGCAVSPPCPALNSGAHSDLNIAENPSHAGSNPSEPRESASTAPLDTCRSTHNHPSPCQPWDATQKSGPLAFRQSQSSMTGVSKAQPWHSPASSHSASSCLVCSQASTV